jgi:hypothetical protein
MKEILIKKSELLSMRLGFGKSDKDIASHYGITEKEAVDAMKKLGIIASRTITKTPSYTIKLEDDYQTQQVNTNIRLEA